MPRIQFYKVRRTLSKGGRYEYLNVSPRGRYTWVPLEIDGTAFDREEAMVLRDRWRASNQNPDVIFHAVVPA